MGSIICNSLVEHLEQNMLVSNNQFGFRKLRSTVSQLLLTLNEWTEAIDSKKCVDSFFFDISKAFDSVSHVKLLQVLSSKGITGKLLEWFQNYLSNRQQYAEIDGAMSPNLDVTSGVHKARC